jgi:chromosome segregation ATPase
MEEMDLAAQIARLQTQIEHLSAELRTFEQRLAEDARRLEAKLCAVEAWRDGVDQRFAEARGREAAYARLIETARWAMPAVWIVIVFALGSVISTLLSILAERR